MRYDRNGGAVETVTLGSDCTVRSIHLAHATLRDVAALRDVRRAGPALRADCGSVEQADITLVQLLVSAAATLSSRGIRLSVEPVSACVQTAFDRSGIALPDAASSSRT